MSQLLSCIGAFFGALVVGGVVILFLLHFDQPFKKLVEKQVKKVFMNAFKSRLVGKVKNVNIVTGVIELEQVTVTPLDQSNEWYWKAEKFVLHFSWLSYILRKKFDVYAFLEVLDSYSQVQGQDVRIIEHLQNFIAGAAGFPATLKLLSLTKGNFTLENKKDNYKYTTTFNGTYGTLFGSLRFHVTAEDGTLWRNKKKIFNNFSASLHSSISDLKNKKINATIAGQMNIPDLAGADLCHLNGHWHNDQGQFFLHTSDNACAFSLYDWKKQGESITGNIACTLPLQYITSFIPIIDISGTAHFQAAVSINENIDFTSELLLHEVICAGVPCGNANLILNRTNNLWQGNVKYYYLNNVQEDLTMQAHYDENTALGSAFLTTTTNFIVQQLGLCIDVCEMQATMQDSKVTGSYKAEFHKIITKETGLLQGTMAYQENNLYINGTYNKKEYMLQAQLIPNFIVKQCSVYEHEEKPLIAIMQEASSFKGQCDFELLQELSTHFFHYKIPGQGILALQVRNEGSMLKGSFKLQEGNIRVPGTFTIIRGLYGTIDFDLLRKKLIISDLAIELDKGMLECSRAVVDIDAYARPIFIYFPVNFQKAFLTFHKDLFAVISGSLLYVFENKSLPKIHGKLIIDRGYCKKNIFSQFSHESNFSLISELARAENLNCLCDITLETKKPLEVKTSFLETQVQVECLAQGSLQNPEVVGNLTLTSGSLAFPYRSLTLTHGSIYFLPNQLFDPTIELVAQGKIRKYYITLRCNGSLQHPTINFESNPPLTEEQIITLLLAGSEEGSLSLAMPALIMQKVQNVIFGPEQSAFKLEGYFKSLLEPLKHIRFIPGFSDQSGRGGFRGSIEVDVSDQLRAMIQKNFSLTEDIKFEVEYFFSDDITIRGIRDERADFGGEIEMRWKF